MIKWDEPYGEHFGGGGNARYTQDGTDFNAQGYELDGDGSVVEKPNVIVANVNTPLPEDVMAGIAEKFAAIPAEVKEAAAAVLEQKVNPAPGDYTALKADIGEEAYAALGKEDKRAGALMQRAERLN
jgi:hypothetical protein